MMNCMDMIGTQSLAVKISNYLIMEMLRSNTPVVLITPQNVTSLPLGSNYDDAAPTPDDYQKIVNRLKIMSGLNPFGSNKTETGEFEVKVAGESHQFQITIAANDASVCLQVR